MKNSKIKPLREPLPRTWFMARGYKQADPKHAKGCIVWLHPKTDDVLTKYGYKRKLRLFPFEKHHKNTTRYLAFCAPNGRIVYLARLKYLTFVELYPDKEPDEIKLTVKIIEK